MGGEGASVEGRGTGVRLSPQGPMMYDVYGTEPPRSPRRLGLAEFPGWGASRLPLATLPDPDSTGTGTGTPVLLFIQLLTPIRVLRVALVDESRAERRVRQTPRPAAAWSATWGQPGPEAGVRSGEGADHETHDAVRYRRTVTGRAELQDARPALEDCGPQTGLGSSHERLRAGRGAAQPSARGRWTVLWRRARRAS